MYYKVDLIDFNYSNWPTFETDWNKLAQQESKENEEKTLADWLLFLLSNTLAIVSID